MSSYLFPPIGGFGNPAHPWVLPSSIPFIDLEAHKGQALLLKVEAKDLTLGITFGPYPPVGVMEDLTWSWFGAKTILYPGATVSRSSRGNDDPADQYVGDVMEASVNYGRSLFSTADPRNISGATEGVIDLLDPQGDLEYLYDYAFDGADLTVFRGGEKDMFSTYGTVAKFTGSVVIGDLDKKQIRVRDLGHRLQGLIHDERYDGLGGLGGAENNKGKWKPYLIGYGFNMEPVLIDGENEVHQWSFAPSATVFFVKHGGVPLTISANYATYELLIAAAIPLGQCATCRAESLVRTNFDREFGIRVDALGDSNTILGHITPENRAEVARRIATGYGESRLKEGTEIDLASFSSVSQQHPADVGFWWGTETTKAAALDEVMRGILGYWHVRPNGQLAIGYIREPTALESAVTIAYQSYGMGNVELIDEAVPWSSTNMVWRRNYAPQSRDQLAGSVIVDEETADILGQEYSTAVSANSSVNQIYPTAVPALIMGNFRNQIDAQDESNRIESLMEVPRRRYRLPMEIDQFADVVDRVGTFTGFNRLKLGSEKLLLCALIDSEGLGQTTTEWWG